MHYLVALTPTGCSQGLDRIPEQSDWKASGIRGGETWVEPVMYDKMQQFHHTWKSSGVSRIKVFRSMCRKWKDWKEYDFTWWNELFVRWQFMMAYMAKWYLNQYRHFPRTHLNTVRLTSRQPTSPQTHTKNLCHTPRPTFQVTKKNSKSLLSSTPVVNMLQSFIITCVCNSGSNRAEPMDWDKQPFYNEGWSRSAIQHHSSC